MTPPPKLAVVQDRDDGLRRLIEERPEKPKVRAFDDLYDDFEELLDFAPDVVFHARDGIDAEDVGALRILRRALPGSRLILIGPAAREVELGRMAERLDARVLIRPVDRRALASALSVADSGPGQASPDTFLDLAKGISDEINNPLLFVAGHLQLLETLLDPDRQVDALEQLRAAQRGLERISSTMDRIRSLGRARALPEPIRVVPIAPLLRTAIGDTPLAVFVPAELEDVAVAGDERLLGTALRTFAEVGAELRGISESCSVSLSNLANAVRVRLEIRGLRLDDWQLPRAFEPYHVNRILRGTAHGLGLFLVQTVVHAHGGEALARRRPDGTVLLDLVLPVATAGRE